MSKEKEERDVVIFAYPQNDNAIAEGSTVNGRTFMNKKYGSFDKQTIPSKDINKLLKEIKENSLSCLFTIGEAVAV